MILIIIKIPNLLTWSPKLWANITATVSGDFYMNNSTKKSGLRGVRPGLKFSENF